ncbi:MAG TPA: ATP-binding protein, partial [Rhodothermales bacterium]|nr:ATP-binding protein [Rhodothermales bacterium]
WVSTGSGILRLDPRSSRITHDAAAVGLPRWGFLREACAPLGPYLLAFGSQDGVVLFRPSDVTRVRRLPTRLTALLVDGREFAPGVPAHRLRSLTLRPTQGGPTFRFATLGATRARRYVYRLDGYDRAWSQPTDRAEAVYPKLPPGRYTFRVRPAFQSAAAEATVRLVVRAPVWRRAWFLALSALLAVALGVAAHRARVAYLLRIERTRRQIADDLHDALGSRTGALALQLEIAAAAPGLPEEAQRRLARAAEDTRLLAAEVHEMVWIVDGGHESVAALMERMEGVAHELLPGRPHRVRVVGEGPDCVLPPRYRRHLLLALREAVHNAARHAEAEHIDIVIEGRAAGLAFEVGDDGRGFDPDAPVGIERAGPGGRGLRTMRARAEAVGGRLEVTSAPGQGTRVRFEAPCPRSGGTLRGGG